MDDPNQTVKIEDSKFNSTSIEGQEFFYTPFNQINRKVSLLLYTGQLLMENGANSSHIMRDLRRVAIYMGITISQIHIHITYNTIMINITDKEKSFTSFRKATVHGANMTTISAISKLTWRALDECYTLDKYESELDRIKSIPSHYSVPMLSFYAGLACGCFTLLFGGSIFSAFITAICAAVGFNARRYCKKLQINEFITIVISAFVATSLANLSVLITGDGKAMSYALISSSLFMIPGIPLINSVDDLFSSYFLSGICRAAYTALVVGSMSLGMTLALHFEFSSSISYLNITPNHIYIVQLIAAALGAIGFSTLFNTPKRLLPVIAIGGLISVGVRNIFLINGLSLIGASLIASIVISIIMMKCAEPCKTAATVLAIPSVIPLIPGVLLYRLMYAIIQLDNLDAANFLQAQRAGFTGIFTVICISLGVALPTLLGQRFIDKQKLKHLLYLIQKRAIRNGYKF